MNNKKLRVDCGKYNIGDIVDGYRITGFSKFWYSREMEQGELQTHVWEDCRCGKQPMYLSHGLCTVCADKIHGTEKQYCYAYLEDKKIIHPSVFKEG